MRSCRLSFSTVLTSGHLIFLYFSQLFTVLVHSILFSPALFCSLLSSILLVNKTRTHNHKTSTNNEFFWQWNILFVFLYSYVVSVIFCLSYNFLLWSEELWCASIHRVIFPSFCSLLLYPALFLSAPSVIFCFPLLCSFLFPILLVNQNSKNNYDTPLQAFHKQSITVNI